MTGRRREDGCPPWQLEAGDYCKRGDFWWVMCPNGNGPARLTGNVRDQHNWDVTEHEDRTITVSPSIEAHEAGPRAGYWHGYLERGVWRSV